jgi:hypothetical protein
MFEDDEMIEVHPAPGAKHAMVDYCAPIGSDEARTLKVEQGA